MRYVLVSLFILVNTACNTVKPWEKAVLSKSEMAWEPQGLESALINHVNFSKEASSGGLSAVGGGCGCN